MLLNAAVQTEAVLIIEVTRTIPAPANRSGLQTFAERGRTAATESMLSDFPRVRALRRVGVRLQDLLDGGPARSL